MPAEQTAERRNTRKAHLHASVVDVVARLLYGIPPRDPATFVAVVALTTAAGAVAAFAPAWRAAHVDPLVAPRQE